MPVTTTNRSSKPDSRPATKPAAKSVKPSVERRSSIALPPNDIVWAALEKVAAKQKDPDELVDGSSHAVNIVLSGDVDGTSFGQSINSLLTVGHRQTRNSSVTPAIPELLAHILSKLNQNTRERIFTDVVLDFVSNGLQLPDVDPGLLHRCKELLGHLRSTRTVEARGPVRVEWLVTGD